MTMVIDRSTPTYKTRYLEIKKRLKSFSDAEKVLIEKRFTEKEIELFGTMDGIDQQIEESNNKHVMVYYIDVDNGDFAFLDRAVLVAKEIEDD